MKEEMTLVNSVVIRSFNIVFVVVGNHLHTRLDYQAGVVDFNS